MLTSSWVSFGSSSSSESSSPELSAAPIGVLLFDGLVLPPIAFVFKENKKEVKLQFFV